MADAILMQNRNSLIARVVSRLRPEVFSHPIWVNFGNMNKPVSRKIIEKLASEAKQIEDCDPDSACQVLLICAVYQNYAGQREEALRTIQQIIFLAERHGLAQETIWATWGACAICVQKGDLDQAASHLQCLQRRFRAQNEWMLANFIEMVEQSLSQYSTASKARGIEPTQDQTAVNLMRLIFNWLQRWGYSAQSSVEEFRVTSHQLLNPATQEVTSEKPLSSRGRWKRYWLTIKRAVRGELKLHWVANASRRESHPMQIQVLNTPPSSPSKLKISPSHSAQFLINDHLRIKPLDMPNLNKRIFNKASLLVYCLGPFRVYQDEQSVDDWPSSKGKAIFKYLVTHREQPVFKDILMDIFWPHTPAESARNNLNVAVYGLRQALRKNHPTYSHVLFINDCYLFNPEIRIWLDYEAFLEAIDTAHELEKNGHLKTAINEYSKAETLYQGDFLVEDRYEDWLLPLRENLQTEYLSLLDRLNHYFFEKQDYQACIHMCRKMLAIDQCSEEAHRHLMRCFFERGQSYLALRQYYLCVEDLKEGLNVAPANGTKQLYEYIRHHS